MRWRTAGSHIPNRPAGRDRATQAPPTKELAGRLVRLYVGLVLYGFSMGLQYRAHLGLEPWSVFHQGVAVHSGLTIGTVTIASGALVLLLWAPLRQRPGLGTVSNVVILGLVMDATIALVPAPSSLWVRVLLLALAITTNGTATGLYISARFGPGPRDGLMTGVHRRTGRPLRLVRTCIEATVLVAGIAMGGSFGVGTVAYALAIGPLAQYFLRRFQGGGARAGGGVVRSSPARTAGERAPGLWPRRAVGRVGPGTEPDRGALAVDAE